MITCKSAGMMDGAGIVGHGVARMPMDIGHVIDCMAKYKDMDKRNAWRRDYYNKNKTTSEYKDSHAQYAKTYRIRYPEKVRAGERVRVKRSGKMYKQYGLTLSQAQLMLIQQHGRCKICQKPIHLEIVSEGKKATACVDHCHDTRRVRGFLCTGCNTAIGKLGDNEKGLMRAVYYLRGESWTDGISEGFLF